VLLFSEGAGPHRPFTFAEQCKRVELKPRKLPVQRPQWIFMDRYQQRAEQVRWKIGGCIQPQAQRLLVAGGITETKNNLGGNGMMNMKSRAQELKGILDIISEKNRGTVMSLRFML
jgi:hypothetical protein